MKRTSKKGFTLMEMLIVIAIIAILIAIAIPVFTAQLNKAKLATDQANARSLKSMVMNESMNTDDAAVVKSGTAGVYYLNKTTNQILTAKGDSALKCEGSGSEYWAGTKSADAAYIWVYWDGTSVTETNPKM